LALSADVDSIYQARRDEGKTEVPASAAGFQEGRLLARDPLQICSRPPTDGGKTPSAAGWRPCATEANSSKTPTLTRWPPRC
jgi:hypothetical protein